MRPVLFGEACTRIQIALAFLEVMMSLFRVPTPRNEPILSYAPGSPERADVDKALADLKNQQLEIPIVINGQELKTGKKIEITAPHDHSLKLGYYHQGGEKEVQLAVDSALEACIAPR
jgi:1-pyrroline-5-carboxylate dehydrogenase